MAFADESPFATTAYIIDAVKNAFVNIPYRTSDPSTACLYVVILGEVESLNSCKRIMMRLKATRFFVWYILCGLEAENAMFEQTDQ